MLSQMYFLSDLGIKIGRKKWVWSWEKRAAFRGGLRGWLRKRAGRKAEIVDRNEESSDCFKGRAVENEGSQVPLWFGKK